MKPPKFLNDLYSDLRDRKLLPLVGVLIVAIVAVPMLLSSEPEPAPSSGTAAVDAAAAATEEIPSVPAVLASDPGLRDYRERLSKLSETNPFGQQVKDLKKAAAEDAAADTIPTASELGSEELGAAPTGDSGAAGGSTSSGGGSASSGATTDDGSSGGTVTDGVDVDDDVNGGGVREYLIRYELDMTIVGPNDTQKLDDVKELDILPGKKTPIAVYVGVTPESRKAVFMLSDKVVKTHGDGSCAPAPGDCKILSFADGQQHTVFYSKHGGTAEKYIFKLHDIEKVVERLD